MRCPVILRIPVPVMLVVTMKVENSYPDFVDSKVEEAQCVLEAGHAPSGDGLRGVLVGHRFIPDGAFERRYERYA